MKKMQTLIKQGSQFLKIRAAFVDQKFFEIKTKWLGWLETFESYQKVQKDFTKNAVNRIPFVFTYLLL